MSTDLILLTLTLMILDVSSSLYASTHEPRINLDETIEEEAEDLPFGPAPSDQD